MRLLIGVGAIVAVLLTVTVLVPVTDDASNPSTVDVIIMDGQSNAAYSTHTVSAAELNAQYTKAPTHTLLYWGTATGPAISATGLYSMYADGAYTIGGYGPVLANEYSQRSGHDVAYLNFGVPGYHISQLIPGSSAGDDAMVSLTAAMAALAERYDRINCVGWCWAQGEADSTGSTNAYISDFQALGRAFEGQGFRDCYIIHTRDVYGGNANIAQSRIAASDGNVKIVCQYTEEFTTADGMIGGSGDEIHYTQKGRNAIAASLADILPVTETQTAAEKLIPIIPVIVVAGLVLAAVTFVSRRE